MNALQIPAKSDGLVYQKWGHEQRGKPGDWIVATEDDLYTVDADVFARTYRQTPDGRYEKTTPVWADRARQSGSIRTKEGDTRYEPGWYLVSNSSDGCDEYAVSPERFESLYVPDDSA